MIDYENMCEFDQVICRTVKGVLNKEKNVISRESLLKEVRVAINISDRDLRRIMSSYFRFDLDFIVISSHEGFIHSKDLNVKKIECNELIEYHMAKVATIDDFAVARIHEKIVDKIIQLKIKIGELQRVKTN